jgi:CotS family spore coat protein
MSLKSEVYTYYGIKTARIIPVRDVYQLTTVQGRSYCLKALSTNQSESNFIANAMVYLRKSGFKYGPRVKKTSEDSWCMELNNSWYVLTNWVQGKTPNFSYRTTYRKAIRRLAKFHRLAEGFPNAIPEARMRIDHLPYTISNCRSCLEQNMNVGDMQPYIELCDQADNELEHADCEKALSSELKRNAFVHGDYNYPNLMLDTRRQIHMIDFDNCSISARMTDLSHILHRNFPWRGHRMLRWIDYYDSIRPLSAGDRHLLYALLLVPYPLVRALKLLKSMDQLEPFFTTSSGISKYNRELEKLLN